jgi:hypothetical protein
MDARLKAFAYNIAALLQAASHFVELNGTIQRLVTSDVHYHFDTPAPVID